MDVALVFIDFFPRHRGRPFFCRERKNIRKVEFCDSDPGTWNIAWVSFVHVIKFLQLLLIILWNMEKVNCSVVEVEEVARVGISNRNKLA